MMMMTTTMMMTATRRHCLRHDRGVTTTGRGRVAIITLLRTHFRQASSSLKWLRRNFKLHVPGESHHFRNEVALGLEDGIKCMAQEREENKKQTGMVTLH